MIAFDRNLVVDGDAVHSFASRAFGHDPAAERGVVHSAAVWDGPNGPRVLKIGPDAPKSDVDFFLLHFARARADVILTTGKILRSEPDLVHDLGASAGYCDALADYRRRYVGTNARARVVVLTSGDIDFAHRGLQGWADPWVFVPASADRELDERAAINGVRLVRLPELDLDRVLAVLRDDGARTVSIEAGVSTTSGRYQDGRGFDELVLSRFADQAIDGRAIGARFPERATVERIYGPARATFDVEEESGRWVFERFRKAELST